MHALAEFLVSINTLYGVSPANPSNFSHCKCFCGTYLFPCFFGVRLWNVEGGVSGWNVEGGVSEWS